MKFTKEHGNLIEVISVDCQGDTHIVGIAPDGEIYCSHENIENEYLGSTLYLKSNPDTDWSEASTCVRYIRLLETIQKARYEISKLQKY